ncbi:flagellum-specific ATP synthase FliI [Gammaproteobacteria bacterium 45_16_T64]|nr:flagellum-specific ATP synthase FliI [Gammaproteobacteria bacterium 45_16_T64]
MDKRQILRAIKHCETIQRTGRVLQFYGLVLEASGPDVFLGEICEIYTPKAAHPVVAEVVGFRDGNVLMMPYGNLSGIHVGSEIVATGRSASLRVGEHLMGRVVDAFGRPIDGKDFLSEGEEYPLYPDPINPLDRQRITEQFTTGIRSIDAMLSVGVGQRVGLFAGSGVGKSTLLGQIAQASSADVNVIALIGERGREVLDFVVENLGEEGLKNSIVVVAGADQPALVRVHAAYAATTIAEYFKNQGKKVFLAMDSITRFAMAQREIGLAIGEPPTARGYTPSAFAQIPKLVERAGNFRDSGSITAVYTVLVEGDDFNEPVSDATRAILDGHIILSRKIATRGRFPAIDLLESVSRLQKQVSSNEDQLLVTKSIKLLSLYQDSKDLIELGAYQEGNNPQLDEAIVFYQGFEEVVSQVSPEEDAAEILRRWLRKNV